MGEGTLVKGREGKETRWDGGVLAGNDGERERD